MFPVTIVVASIIFVGIIVAVLGRGLPMLHYPSILAVGVGLYLIVALVSLPVSLLPYGAVAAVFIEESGKLVVVRLVKLRPNAAIISIMCFAVCEMLIVKLGLNYFVLAASRSELDYHFFYYTLASIVPAVMHLVTALFYQLRFNSLYLLVAGAMFHYVFNNIVTRFDVFTEKNVILLASLLVIMCSLVCGLSILRIKKGGWFGKLRDRVSE